MIPQWKNFHAIDVSSMGLEYALIMEATFHSEHFKSNQMDFLFLCVWLYLAEAWLEEKAVTKLNCIVMLLSAGERLKYDFAKKEAEF